jgi:hypothetical protein
MSATILSVEMKQVNKFLRAMRNRWYDGSNWYNLFSFEILEKKRGKSRLCKSAILDFHAI